MKAKYLALMIGCFVSSLTFGQRIISLLSSVWLNWSNVVNAENGHPDAEAQIAAETAAGRRYADGECPVRRAHCSR